ncbi:hypothetical protein N9N13_01905 [Opitutales bacterium]|nr:hypothetical protein [Opitutales bacterium]
MSKFLFSVIFLFHALCFAEKQSKLSEETQKQLAALVAANDYVAVVEINKGTFTGACMVHDKVKVVAHLKGKLGSTALFSSINADKNALPPAIEPPKKPLPMLKPGTYVVVVEAHEIIHSFPGIKVPFLGRVGKPKPSFNYFIQHNEKSHCAWAVDSIEANYLLELARKSPHSD